MIITLGGALLGYLAGEMLLGDPAMVQWRGAPVPEFAAHSAGALGAIAVVAIGLWWRRHRRAH